MPGWKYQDENSLVWTGVIKIQQVIFATYMVGKMIKMAHDVLKTTMNTCYRLVNSL